MDLKEIKKNLRFGDVKEVALLSGYTKSYVSDVLRGKSSNPVIYEMLCNMAERRKIEYNNAKIFLQYNNPKINHCPICDKHTKNGVRKNAEKE